MTVEEIELKLQAEVVQAIFEKLIAYYVFPDITQCRNDGRLEFDPTPIITGEVKQHADDGDDHKGDHQ